MRNNVVKLNNVFIAMSVALIALVVSLNIQAVTPSPAMVAQFKNLSPAEQQRLAKQNGLGAGSPVGRTTESLSTPPVVGERTKTKPKSTKMKQAGSKSSVIVKNYGYDLFSGEPSTYAPVSDIPVPSEYLMGPGDIVNIQLYGKENQEMSLTVSRSGNIELPNSGPMSVNGLTFEALKNQLTEKINEQYTGVKSHVSLGELRSIRVIITGEAYKPGSYTISSLSTITQALFVSGGVSDIASLRNIQLKRAGKTITTFDLYDLLMKGDASKDKKLRSGDIIFIPPVAITATIKGEVRRPAIYELKGDETANDLINLAAGLKPNSFPKASMVHRYSNEYLPTLINIDLTAKSGKLKKIKDGDVLTVKSTTSTIKNKVILKGAVSRAGEYEWYKGMRISDLISSRWSDLKNNTDFKYSIITREVNINAEIKVIDFSLANIFSNLESQDNLYLQPRDNIIIFAKTSSSRRSLLKPIINKLKAQDSRTNVNNIATISGEVHFPGSYPVLAGVTVSDLVELAGGLKESAYTKQAELTERIINDQLVVDVAHKNIKLDLALNNNTSENITIKNQDKLKILKIPAWQKSKKISLRGQVKFPGSYQISEGETLNDVVIRAGGYTNKAFLYGAIFTRESVKNKERQQIKKFSDQLRLDIATKGLSGDGSGVSFNESSLMLKEIEKVKPVGRMVVSLTKELNSEHDKLLIENNDMLFIPSQSQMVTVVGEVQHPTTHFYKKGTSFDEYINLSGGIKIRADDDRMYIIQANGAVAFPNQGMWFSNSDNIKAGDTLVVPINTEYKDNLTLWTEIVGIITSAAIVTSAVGIL